MELTRANPDELLKRIHQEEEKKRRGNLKIFFGYAAGVGKTYAMLKAAHAAKKRGIDVVAGYIEPHDRPQTAALQKGLERIPLKKIIYHSIELKEFNIDAVLERKPQLVLVDELAHSNCEGSRHSKRYQDVEELLNAGIDVFTTVNVQHMESLNDMVASITGIMVRERIPDRIFDEAAQVELVDIEPQELMERLQAGKIYQETRAQKALNHFFSTQNLAALREIALRRCADRLNKISENVRQGNSCEYFTDENILVCLSSSPTNQKIIRTAARMADAFRGGFTALFVETPDYAAMSEENKERLRSNIHLARQLGATIETTYGDDVAFQIAEFARLSGISKIVVGRNNASRKNRFSKTPLIERLVLNAPNLDVYIIPDKETKTYRERKAKLKQNRFLAADLAKSILILIAATLFGFLFFHQGFSEANIITVYILGVLIISVITTHQAYSLIASVVSVLVFNFFFTDPKYSLSAYDSGYPATFFIMFISAFITGRLAVKIKQQAKQSAYTAYRTKVLLDTNQLLQQAKEKSSIVSVTANQLIKLLGRAIVFYSAEDGKLQPPCLFKTGEVENDKEKEYLSEKEKATAEWVFQNNKHAGATTNTLANAKCLYLAVRVNSSVYGVVGIAIESLALDAFENSILLSILGECALALENGQAAKEKQEAAVLAKNEQLRANLLRSISHDLRTPLTSISGNAGVLLAHEDSLGVERRMQLYRDIHDDSLWLINLVENLLAVTRIEDKTLQLRLTAELIDEVITEALRHLNRKSTEHTITVRQSKDFIMAKMDARLMVQVVINIVDNAIKYTSEGSVITISVFKEKQEVIVEIADDGSGIPDESKPRIFDMFYTAETKIADSRRSLGLGLALCKSIINAHGGEISVRDNRPSGTIFRFTLPAEEVTLHE